MTGMQACGRQPVSLRAARDPAGPPQFGVFARNQRTTEGRKDLGVTVGHIILKVLLYKAIKYGLEEFYIYGLIS